MAVLGNPDMLTRKIKLCHINAHITCRLCEGYLIDATTVTECLHTWVGTSSPRGPDPSQTFCPPGCKSWLDSSLHGLDLPRGGGQIQSSRVESKPGFASYQAGNAFTQVNGAPGFHCSRTCQVDLRRTPRTSVSLSTSREAPRVCRSCLVKYLEENNTCPTCRIVIHQSHPLQYIGHDRTMQDIVYKLVPGLQEAEIKKQREFYQKLGMEVPGDIKGDLCNMKTHLDQRNGTVPSPVLPASFRSIRFRLQLERDGSALDEGL
ncbi:RING finger protein 3 [Takifugu flavidus]|uniref:RING finger protein 3 n=1 Tax=Takifugu flavidus TaxID=433684 RepID=A0A5C6MJX8_9TELE|nr:RING finger protein 3 [Takifugu flavidus]